MKLSKLFACLGALAVAALFNACTTQVAVNPSDSTAVATFRNGVFYGQVAGTYDNVFRAVNKGLDQLGYTRVGEIPEKTSMTVIARAAGDIRIQVKITRNAERADLYNVRIAYNRGDLPASQRIFAKICSNL